MTDPGHSPERSNPTANTVDADVARFPPDTLGVQGDQSILEIALDELEDSPFQVKQYDDIRVKELAESVRRQWLLQPATVRRVRPTEAKSEGSPCPMEELGS